MSNFFVKIYNFVQREFAYTGQVDTFGKYMPYGPGDTLPVELDDLVAGSPTATSCLSTLTDFIAGEGFNEGEDLENLVVNNQGLKLWQFHVIQSESFSKKYGCATLVKYSKTGAITEWYDIPFNYCRLGKPDDEGVISKIHYNPYFGTALFRQQDTEVYDAYNPAAATTQLAKDKKWKGQIYWYGVKGRHPFYPTPDYYSAKHWMSVEKNAGIYFDENLKDGFLQDVMVKMIGDPNDPSGLKDDKGEDIPKGKAFDKEMTENFGQGAKTRHKLIALWATNKEEFPEIAAMPTSGNPDLFRLQDEHAIKKITIATKVPAILANISEGVSLGGDGNTIRAAVKLMQQRVKRPQGYLIDYYSEMLSKMANPITEPITIVPYNPFPELESVDAQVWEVLTPEERRQWVKDHTEIDLMDANVATDQNPEPPPAQNQITNLFFNSYPKTARENVKRAMEWQVKMDAKCLKPAGLKMSQRIIDGSPLSQSEIRRLSNFLSKNTVHKNKPYGDACESLMYDAWGGSEMMTWANDKLKELSGKVD
jgi:hypothetical protein